MHCAAHLGDINGGASPRAPRLDENHSFRYLSGNERPADEFYTSRARKLALAFANRVIISRQVEEPSPTTRKRPFPAIPLFYMKGTKC